MVNEIVYKQPRDSRVIAGVVMSIFGVAMLFFTTLVALESFSQNPLGISLFLLLGMLLFTIGLYFLTCIPIVEIDTKNRNVITMTSCILFKTKKLIPFVRIKEIGIKEKYFAGDRSEETGTSYYVEIRGSSTIEVPGTKSYSLSNSEYVAKELAGYIGTNFSPKVRKVYTGSYKLK